MSIRELTADEEWDHAVSVLRELWTDASASFVRSWREDPEYHYSVSSPTGRSWALRASPSSV